MKNEILDSFENPGSEFRGAPFWAWNGKLDSEELRRQIRVMKEMGLGGFFMHSRVGLDTPYLSKDWFECVEACIDEAEKLDMNAWLYDEDRWPSGAAGGLVTKNPEHRAKKIVMLELQSTKNLKIDDATIAVFAVKLDGDRLEKVKKLSHDNLKLEKGETLLQFKIAADEPSSWYNGQTYLDTLNKKAVATFLKSTHEKYKKEISEHFGKRVPGIFTDEPNHNPMCHPLSDHETSAPWTQALPSVFKKRYGYDIIDHLPAIFLDSNEEKYAQARYHFHDCVTHLFVDAFARQIGEWCEKNNLQHTGHVLAEETLGSQTSHVGSCMRFYEHMQAPGMDILTEHRREYDTAKQVASAARQFDRKWRLTETYGCTGWDFPFAGHKTIGDWQAALGINLRCQHLVWYTMLGEAKRDYPASIFQQSPWWEAYSKVENYFARIHSIMTRGREIRELLVIHPNESMWLLCKKGWPEKTETSEYENMIIDLRDSLLFDNIDFDYGDEEIISRTAKLAGKGDSAKFAVGAAEYSAVLVPPLKTIRSTTLKLLSEFKKRGGQVVFAGEPPKLVDALPSEAAAKLADSCDSAPPKGAELAETVAAKTRVCSIRDANGREIADTLYLLKQDLENIYLFVCSQGHSESQMKALNGIKDFSMVVDRKTGYENVDIIVSPPSEGVPLELDPDTGEVFEAEAARSDGKWRRYTSLPPLGSRLFVLPLKKQRKSFPKRRTLATSKTETLKASWNYSLSEDNALVLDAPRFRVNAGKWHPRTEVLRVDWAAKDAIDQPHRGGMMVQPWAREKISNGKTAAIELEYAFNIDARPAGALKLALERPETFKITLNGHLVSASSECGWWCDKSLRLLPINPAFLKIGKNTLKLRCEYDANHPGFEIVYLLGSFGVELDDKAVATMTQLPKSLKIGDWTAQKLPFFAGSLTYAKTAKASFAKNDRIFVSIPKYAGVAARVLVDGEKAGIIAWEPNEIDITDKIESGKEFELGIEIMGHRRNSHGPLHNPEKWPEWTGSRKFLDPPKPSLKYNLVPCGLMKPPALLVKRKKL